MHVFLSQSHVNPCRLNQGKDFSTSEPQTNTKAISLGQFDAQMKFQTMLKTEKVNITRIIISYLFKFSLFFVFLTKKSRKVNSIFS